MQHLLRILFFVLLLGNLFPAHAQVNYRAGYAKTSLEPAVYPFSLSLAGYGAPRDGRFTLEWIRKGEAAGCTAFGSVPHELLAIRQDELITGNIAGAVSWKIMGKANGIRLLAGSKTGIYAIDESGNILHSVQKQKLNWKKTGRAENAIAMAVSEKAIYIADKNGEISFAALNNRSFNWQKLAVLAKVQSLAVYKGSLYALTADDDLIKFDLDKNPLRGIKIARYNGISYDVKLKAIAVANNTLYGIDQADNIYAGRHRTEGDLSVTALAVASGKQTVVMVGVDVCGFNSDFITSIKQEIFRKTKIPAAAILVNASHTHFAPVTQNWLTWGEHNQQPDSIYLNSVVKPAMINAIQTAVSNMAPSRLSFGRGKTAIGGNRAFTKAPLPYDDDVDVISIERIKDKERTVLFLTGCHPVFRNEGAEGITISANYPAVTRQWLNEKGSISKSLFIQGCGGDINPLDASHVNTGNKLAHDISTVLNSSMKELSGNISFFMDSVSFPVKNWTNDALMEFRNRNSGKEGDVYAEKNVRWSDLMLQLQQENRMPASMPVYIQTINIGRWKLVGLSREAVTDYSIGIKKLWPGQLVSVAGYCNDVSSYLPVQRHIVERGYEGFDSFFWYGQPSVFPESVYDDILNKIKQQNH